MGKTNTSVNLPTNPSLSYTLNDLTSTVELRHTNKSEDTWLPLGEPFNLSPQSQKRFLSHLHMLKHYFNYTGHFEVASCNGFPLGCGLASSASSFAALTKCAVIALTELTQRPLLATAEQAMLSRQGSGSSCRSFFSPWSRWHDNVAEEITFPYQTLLHQVIVISDKEKAVSSSKAHQLVTTSPAFKGRTQRAENRLIQLTLALNAKHWEKAFKICWDEFIDMHHLFQTAQTPFDYMTEPCRTALNLLDNFWQTHANGPLVTMDAGPNIHLLYRPEDKALKEKFERDHLKGSFNVI